MKNTTNVSALPQSDFPVDSVAVKPKYNEFRRIIRVFLGRKIAVVGLLIIMLLIFTAIFAQWLAPYNPYKINFANKLMQPCAEYWLGTDSLGRDILSRIIYGSRTSLIVGIGAVGIAVLIGESLGLIAGYYGGAAYAIIMRFTDTLMAIPMLLNALIIAAVLGGGLHNVIFALGIGLTASQCRMMCAQVISVKQNDYILAGRAIGISDVRMMLEQIFPNAFPPLLVMITVALGAAILAEAGLSFLGLGIDPPGAAWGSMVNDGYKYLLSNPLLSFAPGGAIMLTVFGFNMMGDGLRDALDPKLRGVI